MLIAGSFSTDYDLLIKLLKLCDALLGNEQVRVKWLNAWVGFLHDGESIRIVFKTLTGLRLFWINNRRYKSIINLWLFIYFSLSFKYPLNVSLLLLGPSLTRLVLSLQRHPGNNRIDDALLIIFNIARLWYLYWHCHVRIQPPRLWNIDLLSIGARCDAWPDSLWIALREQFC